FVNDVGPRLISQLNSNLVDHHWGDLAWDNSRSTLMWTGLPPMIAPYLKGVSTNNGDFALLGFFPGPSRSNSPPTRLFEQLGQTTLVFYDWEITGEHVVQCWNSFMLYHILQHLPLSSPQDPAQKWIDAVTKRAGNAVTEVTTTAPNELTLLRKSPL